MFGGNVPKGNVDRGNGEHGNAVAAVQVQALLQVMVERREVSNVLADNLRRDKILDGGDGGSPAGIGKAIAPTDDAVAGLDADEGEVEFGTSDGQLKVTRFECKSRATRSILRGQFTYTPAITRREADAANAASVGGERVTPRPDNISGSLEPCVLGGGHLPPPHGTSEQEKPQWQCRHC